MLGFCLLRYQFYCLEICLTLCLFGRSFFVHRFQKRSWEAVEFNVLFPLVYQWCLVKFLFLVTTVQPTFVVNIIFGISQKQNLCKGFVGST